MAMRPNHVIIKLQGCLLSQRKNPGSVGHAICIFDGQRGRQSPGQCSSGSRFCQALLPAALLGVFDGGKIRLRNPVCPPTLRVGGPRAACFGRPQIAAQLQPEALAPRLAPDQAVSLLSRACRQVTVFSTAPLHKRDSSHASHSCLTQCYMSGLIVR